MLTNIPCAMWIYIIETVRNASKLRFAIYYLNLEWLFSGCSRVFSFFFYICALFKVNSVLPTLNFLNWIPSSNLQGFKSQTCKSQKLIRRVPALRAAFLGSRWWTVDEDEGNKQRREK
ncbi:uncharacterized protein LOC143175161 [Nomia melanderi]|uniref:uncharacterized protein LOC143175161 n=1 Tax=Nomia melanderi TaxID=2448451 RepID=UPI003FCC9F92